MMKMRAMIAESLSPERESFCQDALMLYRFTIVLIVRSRKTSKISLK